MLKMSAFSVGTDWLKVNIATDQGDLSQTRILVCGISKRCFDDIINKCTGDDMKIPCLPPFSKGLNKFHR